MLEESSADRTRFPQGYHLSLTVLHLSLLDLLDLYLLLFSIVYLDVLHSRMANVCPDLQMRSIYACSKASMRHP